MSFKNQLLPGEIAGIYAHFRSPISELDCGKKCAPYNENGVPFCCDTDHAVPTAYQAEWQYLQQNTDIWKPFHEENAVEAARLEVEAPEGQILIACRGVQHCQRGFRSLTCRAFPFFPYINGGGEFLGLSYYWEYEDRCWVISNLQTVQPEYRSDFIGVYDKIFEQVPDERENFGHYSAVMRQDFTHKRRTIPLLHRDGKAYKISPATEKMRRVPVENLPRFGVYQIAARLPFPGES